MWEQAGNLLYNLSTQFQFMNVLVARWSYFKSLNHVVWGILSVLGVKLEDPHVCSFHLDLVLKFTMGRGLGGPKQGIKGHY